MITATIPCTDRGESGRQRVIPAGRDLFPEVRRAVREVCAGFALKFPLRSSLRGVFKSPRPEGGGLVFCPINPSHNGFNFLQI